MFLLASYLYFTAAALFVITLVKPERYMVRAAESVWAGAFAFHTVVVAQSLFDGDASPVRSLGEGFSLLAWLVAALFLLLQWRYRLPSLGLFVGPLLVAFVIPASLFGGAPPALPGTLAIAGIQLHILSVFLGLAFISLAAGLSAAFITLERQLRARRFGLLFERLPSLDRIDLLAAHCVKGGFIALSIGLMAGAFFARRAWGSGWMWDPKLLISVAAWALFAALLQGRALAGWRGRRSAVITLCGFALLLASFLWFGIFPTGKHGGGLL